MMHLYHGTPKLDAVLKAGVIKPSKRRELLPSLDDALAAYKKMIKAAKAEYEPGLTWKEIIPDEIDDWQENALIPMYGYAYATTHTATANLYAQRLGNATDPGVVEVEFTNDNIIPDEDWIGCVAASLFSTCTECDYTVGFGLSEPVNSYEDWAAELHDMLSPKLYKTIERVNEFIEEEINWDGYCALPMTAVLGRTVIRDLQRNAAGRDWLTRGVEFTDRFAHRGPLKVVKHAW
jgi:hypothetical protein